MKSKVLMRFILSFTISMYGFLVLPVQAESTLSQIKTSSIHPSLFFTLDDLSAIRKRSMSQPWLRETREQIRKKADAYMALQSEPYALVTQYNGFGTAGRGVQNFVGTLAFAGHLFDEPKYLQKAKTLLLAIVDQTEPDNPKHWRSHLQIADATQGLVLGYDLVYPVLSKAERKRVLDEIYGMGLALTHHKSAWGMEAPGVLSCNHNAVHYGALGLVALVLWDRNIPQREYWLNRSVERVDGYLATFIDSTGYGTEGHHYFAYGLGGSTVFSYALARAGGPDLMAKNTTVALAADQILWKLLPVKGRMLALNDNEEIPSDVAGMAGSLLYQKPEQLWAWLESLYASNSKHLLAGSATTTYTTPFLFLWGDKSLAPKHPATTGVPLGHKFESGRVFLRNSWSGEDAAHFSLTSGYDFHRGHDHQDENSVTFFALGEGFLIDPRYMPERSDAHTTLSVNGAEQIKGGDGRIAAYREDEHGAMVRGQAEEAYDFAKEFIGVADRKAYFVRGPNPYLVFRDDMQLESDKVARYAGRYITYPDNKITQDGKAAIIHGERGKAYAKIMVFSGGKQIKIEEDNLKGKTFERRGRQLPYLDFMRRLKVEVNKVNPKFVSLVMPFKNKKALPETSLQYDKKTDTHILTLKYKSGKTDQLTLTANDISLDRSNPKAKHYE